MTPLFTTDAIRALERAGSQHALMEKAGLAAATLARDLMVDGDRILLLAGPGNNGGDAFVAARHLRAWWFKVTVLFSSDRERLPADAAAALNAWLATDGRVETQLPAERFDLIIDGLFGIGLSKPLQGESARLVQAINALGCPVLALDVPSGLCADSGRVLGTAIRASHTLTFLGLKPGLFTLAGPDHAGVVHVTDLGIDTGAANGHLIDGPPALPHPRQKNAHKGNFGSTGILGGASSMVGAALLAARAALLIGAGRVYVGLLDENGPAVDAMQPELMLRPPQSLLDSTQLSALAIGPGLGRSAHAIAVLQQALELPYPLLLDADALHLLAADPALRQRLGRRTACTLLTPHPGEASALLACSVAEVQDHRIRAALEIAGRYHAITILKGCGSIIAMPDGRWFINDSGNPGMSAAGMGDVLCGLITGLISQGMDGEAACLLGVYLHGAAGDAMAEAVGQTGITASEVALAARGVLNRWRQHAS